MRVLLALVVLAALALCGLALGAPRAEEAAARPAPAALQAALDRATALVGERRRFGYRVVVAPREGATRAQLDRRARTITLFVDPHDAPHRLAHDLAHELGHAYDLGHMTDADRAAYLRARGVPDWPWWVDNGADDYAVGAGDFAETFAACHAASPEFRSDVAARPADPCGMLPRDAQTPEP
jgi:hypothetical protein